ncbi:MAG: TRAP transporter small permease [Thiohalomonadales bacterium]
MLQNKKINSIVFWLHRLEDGILIFILANILLFAIIQIFLRNFFDSGLIWGDVLLRILVLWLTLAGAIVATRQGKQINIDILSQFIPENYKKFFKNLNSLFAALVCLLISYFSFEFVYSEYISGDYAFGVIPLWLTESIIPLGFGIMGIKYVTRIMTNTE